MEPPPFSKDKSTIMVIDDIRNYIKTSLANDFNNIDFDNATNALSLAKKKDVSLIFCDIMMPVWMPLNFVD